jgi:diguanylate cyclase (GGDEF)-like protein/PAS domain S-box-containing protein
MAAVLKKSQVLSYQCLVAAMYCLLSYLTLEYAAFGDGYTVVWPAAGFAIGVLIRFGLQFAVGVFIGALAACLMKDYPTWVSIAIALGDTIAPFLAVYLLRVLPFSSNLYRSNDFLSLVFASGLTATLSTLIGGNSYLSMVGESSGLLVNWWMSDVLGIVLLTPLLLLYTPVALSKVVTRQSLEALVLIVFSIIIAMIVLRGWDFGVIEQLKSSYLLTIPLVWAILRFGQVMTALLVFEYALIGVWGLTEQQGFFVAQDAQVNLVLFWTYFMVMALISLTISYIVNERNTLYQAINRSQVSSYIFSDQNLRFEFVNNATLEDLGVSFGEALKLGPVDLKPFYEPEQFRVLLEPLSNQEKTSLSFETVIRSAKGPYPAEVYIQNINHLNRTCYFASVIDISERLEHEQRLRLGNQVCELTPQAIMVTDKDNLIIRVNSAFTDITGYEANEVLGHHPEILNSDRHNQLFYEAFWHRLHHEKLWKGEVYSCRKNGEVYLQSLTIKLVHDLHGEIENYIAMFTDITQEREQAMHFKQLAEIDNLTNLPNRILLQQSFQSAIALAKRNKGELAVLYIDLNDFKPINDTYGHAMGDIVLKKISERMKACVRDSDTVSRIGGDEFSVLLSSIENIENCHALANKIKQAINEPIIDGDISIKLTASIGIACFPNQGDTLEALLNYADLSMYKDKEKMKQV